MKNQNELFVVEHENGEWGDATGEGGWSVFANISEAQDELESSSDSGKEKGWRIVKFVRESKSASPSEPPNNRAEAAENDLMRLAKLLPRDGKSHALPIAERVANYIGELKDTIAKSSPAVSPDAELQRTEPHLPTADKSVEYSGECECEPPKSADDEGYVCPVHAGAAPSSVQAQGTFTRGVGCDNCGKIAREHYCYPLNDEVSHGKFHPSEARASSPLSAPPQSIDISNLRFYSAMARDFKWQTDVIHWSVISKTLQEIADRLASDPASSAGTPEGK